MGCGASATGPASPEQKQAMALATCNDMIRFLVDGIIMDYEIVDALNDLTIPAPPVQEMEKLRKLSSSIQDKVGGGAEIGEEEKAVVLGIAQVLNDSIQILDEKFPTAAKEIVCAKRKEVHDVYIACLSGVQWASPALDYVRGEAPWGENETKNCTPTKISNAFLELVGRANLKEALTKAVREELDKSTTVDSWKKATEEYNNAKSKVTALNCDAVEQLEIEFGDPIDFDIEQYIIDEAITKLGQLMAENEPSTRRDAGHFDCEEWYADRAGKILQHKSCFRTMFFGMEITKVNYNEFLAESPK